jgi:cytidylate kinase
MVERDRRSTRSDSPLKIAKDAVVIDSTGLSIQKFRTDDGRSA